MVKSLKAMVLYIGVVIMLLFGLTGIAIGAPTVANWAQNATRARKAPIQKVGVVQPPSMPPRDQAT